VDAELVNHSQYIGISGDPTVEDLLEKYDDIISPANKVIGFNKSYKNSYYLCQLMADLYYDMGVEEWGDEYDIVLGGGYLSTRSPYDLSAGDVTYADVQSLFPFDNQLLLCSIKGVYLKSRFFATGNDDYYICYDEYGSYVKQNLNPSATYYVVVDSYTAYYAPNHLTVVEEYDPNIFPRDLLAQHIKDGGLS
jgi:2',3'-cyclic-nucleotide 2'-phosphodiesterase (5'-nucleotidase family)